MKIQYKFGALIAGFMLAMCVSAPLYADDIEIYTSGGVGTPTIQPNVMFIVDTSGSMSSPVTTTTYDPNTVYSGSYDKNYIYFSTTGGLPSTSLRYAFLASSNTCDNSIHEYDKGVLQTASGSPLPGPLITKGYYIDQMAQFTGSTWSAIVRNNNSTQRGYLVECAADAGINGPNASSANKWIIDNSSGWTNTSTSPAVWSGGQNQLYIYSANYLNFKTGGGATSTTSTRLDVVKSAVQDIVDTYNGINICLMRYDSNSPPQGGAVMYPCLDVKASRNDFNSRLKVMTAGGYTPLAETYYEALRYFGGKAVDYGSLANPSNQTGTTVSGDPKYYQTPITSTCQKNYIIYLTDGAPEKDYLSQSRLTDLTTGSTGASSVVGQCDMSPATSTGNSNLDAFSSLTSTDDNCLDELAGWARNNDVAIPLSGHSATQVAAFNGEQTITTFTVGFGSDVGGDPDAVQLLKDTATAGGGKFYEATDGASLTKVFGDILSQILAINSTFTSPAVSVNAFNRATNLDDLYFTLFKPASGPHWDGNLKKYKLVFDTNGNPIIEDQNGNPAVDSATGFFAKTSTSYWTQAADAPDGGDPAKGGAASRLTLPTGTPPRLVYTYTGTYSNNNGVMVPSATTADLTSSADLLDYSNYNATSGPITDAMLGNVASNSDVTYPHAGSSVTVPYPEAELMWAEGYDIWDDSPQNGEAIEARRLMADPLHAQPGLVQYGGIGSGCLTTPQTNPCVPDMVAYVATNDGYLHAISTITGQEYWSFVPQELLPNLNMVFQDAANTGSVWSSPNPQTNPATTLTYDPKGTKSDKSYGLDGDVVPWINDANNDGFIKTTTPGDSVYLYFGQRRGGRDYYAMDVTDRTKPKLMWMIDGGVGDFANLGYTWSTPDVAKLKIGGVDTEVLIFGGGYDPAEDSNTVRTPDSIGSGIYIVDAKTGKMLWHGGSDATATETFPNMKYSIPSRVTALDVNGDGYIDRLYVGDMGGQIWRFDIKPSDTSSDLSTLITGGRIADLSVDADATQDRRFYYAPDVALINDPNQPAPYLAVVAVSGYRAHPLNTTIHDQAYMIRDTRVYDTLANSDYGTTTEPTVTQADLYDATQNLIGGGNTSAPTATQQATASASLAAAQGWYLNLQDYSTGNWIGEKGLSEPLIINGSAIFTTYLPTTNPATATDSCIPSAGTGRAYYVNVVDAQPTYPKSSTLGTAPDRYNNLTRTGIPPSPNVIVTDSGSATCVGAECTKPNIPNTVQKSYWYEKEQ